MRLVDGHGGGCDTNKPWQQIAKRRAALGRKCLFAERFRRALMRLMIDGLRARGHYSLLNSRQQQSNSWLLSDLTSLQFGAKNFPFWWPSTKTLPPNKTLSPSRPAHTQAATPAATAECEVYTPRGILLLYSKKVLEGACWRNTEGFWMCTLQWNWICWSKHDVEPLAFLMEIAFSGVFVALGLELGDLRLSTKASDHSFSWLGWLGLGKAWVATQAATPKD